MKIKEYVILSAASVTLAFLAYFVWFYIILHAEVSKDPADWGQFGSYAGGIIGPLLSFISVVLLIKSLTLQYEANKNLRVEISNNEKTEKIRSFETLFFNLISSQRSLFDVFSVVLPTTDRGASVRLSGPKAVIEIENAVQAIRDEGGSNEKIVAHLALLDEDDQLFAISRAFYVIAMIITEKLSDREGFSLEDRKDHYKVLINLTDFAQLRLIMMCIQFFDYESARYFRSSREFEEVIKEIGLSYELY